MSKRSSTNVPSETPEQSPSNPPRKPSKSPHNTKVLDFLCEKLNFQIERSKQDGFAHCIPCNKDIKAEVRGLG